MTVAQVVGKLMDEYDKAKDMSEIGKPFLYALEKTAKWADTYEEDRHKRPPEWAKCKDCIWISEKYIKCLGHQCKCPEKNFKSQLSAYKQITQKACKKFKLKERGESNDFGDS